MTKKQYAVFFAAIILICSLLTWYLLLRQPTKDELNITFVDKNTFKVGEEIDPVDLVKSSSSAKILYPTIDSSQPGEKNLLYIAVGEHGEQKEFMKKITIISVKPPLLKLAKEEVTITEGDPFDPKEYIEKAVDTYDGELEVAISGNYDLNKVGTYTITYKVKNSSNLKTVKTLKLIVIAKKQNNNETSDKEEGSTVISDSSKETDSQNVPETGTSNQPIITQKQWYVAQGYGFEDARTDCMAAGKQSGAGTYSCKVIMDENGIAVGYELVN